MYAHTTPMRCLRRFAVLVCGTLVYSKGDTKEEEEDEQLFGSDALEPAGPPSPTPQYNALPTLVPGREASTQPITMRGTPSSLKVGDRNKNDASSSQGGRLCLCSCATHLVLSQACWQQIVSAVLALLIIVSSRVSWLPFNEARTSYFKGRLSRFLFRTH